MLHKGNRPEALKNFLEAIRNDPNNLPARTNLGLYYYTEGKYDEAVEQYAFANQINPDPLLYFKIGIARRDEGNDQEAIANFRQALAMAPDFNAAREELDALITKSAQLQ
jgi:tetratricopeptide (TPR) repeat protein